MSPPSPFCLWIAAIISSLMCCSLGLYVNLFKALLIKHQKCNRKFKKMVFVCQLVYKLKVWNSNKHIPSLSRGLPFKMYIVIVMETVMFAFPNK